MKQKNTFSSLHESCKDYIEKYNVYSLSQNWKQRVAYAAVTATMATGLFLGAAQQSEAQNCLPAFSEVPFIKATPEFPGGNISYSRPTLVDIDGDGDEDMFIGSGIGNGLLGVKGSQDLFFVENIGTPLEANFDYANTQTNPFGLTVLVNQYFSAPFMGDIDGDGDQDMLVGDAFNNGVLFYRNTGTTTAPQFAAPVVNPFGLVVPTTFNTGTLGDIDNDGDLDLLLGNGTGGTRFYRNTGTRTAPAFGAALINTFGLTDIGSYSAPSFVDLDGDGDLDVMIGELTADFNYFKNTGTRTAPAFAAVSVNAFEIVPATQFDNGYGYYYFSGPVFADLNNDGDFDMYSGSAKVSLGFPDNASVIKYTNAGTPALADFLQPPYNLKGVAGGADPTLVDIDGDGDKDSFVGRQNGGLVFTKNDGTPSSPLFSDTQVVNPFGFVASGSYSSPDFADLDGDGDYDLILGNNTGNFRYYRNTGTSTAPAFAAAQVNPFGLVGSSAGTFNTPFFVDMDGDGDIDLVTGGTSGNTAYFENTGTPTAPQFAAPKINPFGLTNEDTYSAPTFVDMDNDGDLDAFIGTIGSVFFYSNNGSIAVPNFAAPQDLPFGLTTPDVFNMPYPSDYNANGSTDMLIGLSGGGVLVFDNNKFFPTISIALTGNFNDCNVEQVKATIGGFGYTPADLTVTWYNSLTNLPVATGVEFNPEDLQFRGSYYAIVSTADGCRDISSTLSYEPVTPPVGTTLSAQAGYNTATLNWVREGNCDSPIREYEVYTDPGQFGSYFLSGYSSTTSFEVVGLTNGEKVNFKVRPIFINGTYGVYSNTVTVKPSIVLGEDENAKAGFAFFPNPNNGEFNLRLQDGSRSATVSVTSLSGQRVYTTTLNATQTSINLGNIAAGMYIVRVETAQGTYQQKVSVVR